MKSEGEESAFAADVREGLSSSPKFLRSKHFYDARGDELFQRIMELEEYYPTRAEDAILRDQGRAIMEEVLQKKGPDPLNIVDLGSGDGAKTRHLLNAIPSGSEGRVRYLPNDISSNVLEELQRVLEKDLPDLKLHPLPGDHSEILEGPIAKLEGRKLLLFLGGNIGNSGREEGEALLRRFAAAMDGGDRLLIGFDLRKDPERIHRAYNDREGVTKAFNMNLLERMNRELGADFDTDAFIHYPIYDPLESEARSYLVSTREQEVTIQELDMQVYFEAWEAIFMERSRKFSLGGVEGSAERTGFRVQEHYRDPDGDFVDSLWVRESS